MVTLSGANTYGGGTTLGAGTLSVGAYADLPTVGGLTFNGGTLLVSGTGIKNLDAYTVNWNTFNGGLNVGTAGNTLTVTNAIGGAGSLSRLGPGTLVLSGANGCGGDTTVDGEPRWWRCKSTQIELCRDYADWQQGEPIMKSPRKRRCSVLLCVLCLMSSGVSAAEPSAAQKKAAKDRTGFMERAKVNKPDKDMKNAPSERLPQICDEIKGYQIYMDSTKAPRPDTAPATIYLKTAQDCLPQMAVSCIYAQMRLAIKTDIRKFIRISLTNIKCG